MARILVVDDNPDILFVVEQVLLDAGHEVTVSSDAKNTPALALEMAAEAIVLDIMMPDVSGFDVLRKLRSQSGTRDVPVLLLSALSHSRDRVRGLREGADDYLTKPFNLEELNLRIERMIGRRRLARPTPPRESDERRLLTPMELEKSLSTSGERLVAQVYLGRYQALEVIGKGAMGLVFRGWDPRLKRPVALKTLRVDKLADVRDLHAKIDQLLAEAVTAARFNHPNIVAVYDAESGSGLAYMAMEYVDGTSLAAYLEKRAPLAAEQVLPLGLAVARALEAAHERSVVHHDVKPGNVLLGRDGSIKVSDFGIAKLGQSLAEAQAKVFGTLGYLPPETLQKRRYDHRGDLFALGAVLYECLTGCRAFGGRTNRERMARTLQVGGPPAPRALVDTVPPEVEELVLDLLEKDPEDRPVSAAEVAGRLTELMPPETPWDPELTDVRLPGVEVSSLPSSIFAVEGSSC